MSQNAATSGALKGLEPVTLAAGITVFRAGDPCLNFYFVQNGSIRVDLINAEGKSVLLYRIGANETCVLTTSCLLSHEQYSAEATTETDVTALVVPKAEFERRLEASPQFREIVFRSFSARLARMMAKVDEVAFSPMNERIARRLLELAEDGHTVAITHDRLASDLGSAREVISRKLVKWEERGLIERSRGTIKILSPGVLAELANLGD